MLGSRTTYHAIAYDPDGLRRRILSSTPPSHRELATRTATSQSNDRRLSSPAPSLSSSPPLYTLGRYSSTWARVKQRDVAAAVYALIAGTSLVLAAGATWS